MFNFRLKTNIAFGVDRSAELGQQIQGLGYKNIGIILDQGVKEHDQTLKALESVQATGLSHEVFVNEKIEPDYNFLDEFKVNFVGKGFDCLVGIGGGSTLDLAKGMATLVTNDGPALTYRGFPQLENQPIPVIAVPTTAGTGSEVTFNAVFTDSDAKKKLGINSELNFPVLAIIDPLFTVDCPKTVTVSSGVDALVHTLESYMNVNHTQASRLLSREAFRLLFNNLSKVLDHPSDVHIRSEIALGAYYAGAALINSGPGISGALSYPLGVHHKVPHGYAGGVFLPAVVKFNCEKGYKAFDELYDLINGSDGSMAQDQKNEAFINDLEQLIERLGVYEYMNQFGLKSDDLDALVEESDGLKGAIDQNPIQTTKEDINKIVYQSLSERKEYARL